MPRTTNKINPDILEALKEEVLIVYNKPFLKSIDCERLAKAVSEKVGKSINGISFKRLYGFAQYPFNPSYQTLDILSDFVGKQDWFHFQNYFNKPSLINASELDFFLSVYNLDFINQIEHHDGGLQSLSRKIAKRLRQDPIAFSKIADKFAQNKYAQIFFVEHFPDYDNLINFYYTIFEKYLLYKTTDEAKVFGNSLLFLKSFWIKDKKACKVYLKEINSVNLNLEFHPYVIGRYYVSNLLFSHFYLNDENINFLINKVFYLSEQLPKEGKHFIDFPAFQYLVSEALLHIGKFEDVIKMVDLSFKNYKIKMEFVRKGYYRQLLMFKAEALYELDNTDDAKRIFSKIQPSNFYFFSEKYYTALYLILKNKLYPSERTYAYAKRIITKMNNTFLLEKLEKMNV